MPIFAPRPLTTSFTIPVELPDSKDSQYRNCNSTNSLIHNRSWCGQFNSKIKLLLVLIFHRMLCCGSKKWRWLIPRTSQHHRGQFMERIFHTSRCWTRRLIASALNKIIQNSQFKKKVSLQEQKLGAVQNRYIRLFLMTPRKGPIRPTSKRTLFRKKPTISNQKPTISNKEPTFSHKKHRKSCRSRHWANNTKKKTLPELNQPMHHTIIQLFTGP